MANHPDAGIDHLRDLKEQCRAGALHHSIRCLLQVKGNAPHVCPPIRLVFERPSRSEMNLPTGSVPFIEMQGNASGWRVALEAGYHPGANGVPPQTVEAGRMIDHPHSTLPKPWGYFQPDCADVESYALCFGGDHAALAQYKTLARMIVRALRGCSIPEPIRSIVLRADRLVERSDDATFWTVLLFAFAWEGVAPCTIGARKATWFGDVVVPVEAAARDRTIAVLRNPACPFYPSYKDTPIPTDWRHFFSVLEPDALRASADMLGEIIRVMEHEQYRPARWFTSNTSIPAERLRKAAAEGRLRVRGEEGTREYSVSHARELWRHDFEKPPPKP